MLNTDLFNNVQLKHFYNNKMFSAEKILLPDEDFDNL